MSIPKPPDITRQLPKEVGKIYKDIFNYIKEFGAPDSIFRLSILDAAFCRYRLDKLTLEIEEKINPPNKKRKKEEEDYVDDYSNEDKQKALWALESSHRMLTKNWREYCDDFGLTLAAKKKLDKLLGTPSDDNKPDPMDKINEKKKAIG